MSATPGTRPRVLYGRRRGRKLRPGREQLLRSLLPRVAIRPPDAGGRLDPRAAFPAPPGDVWLEIGFGAGEHLAFQARAHPDIGLIGCEAYLNGVASLLSYIDREGLANIRVVADDARPLLEALPDASIGRAFLLYPDPWPKSRHRKRRFISWDNLELLARVLKDGAELRFATDEPGYLVWTLEHLIRHPAFVWLARSPADWRTRPADWPPTRYELKATRQGRVCTYLSFERRRRSG